jgi:electron transfer flavoprotein alpha subunit
VRSQLRSSNPASCARRARCLSSLAILEQRNGKLNSSSQAAVAAAQRLGGPVTAFVAGTGAKLVAEEAAKIKGIEKVIFVENPAYDKVCWLALLSHSLQCVNAN